MAKREAHQVFDKKSMETATLKEKHENRHVTSGYGGREKRQVDRALKRKPDIQMNGNSNDDPDWQEHRARLNTLIDKMRTGGGSSSLSKQKCKRHIRSGDGARDETRVDRASNNNQDMQMSGNDEQGRMQHEQEGRSMEFRGSNSSKCGSTSQPQHKKKKIMPTARKDHRQVEQELDSPIVKRRSGMGQLTNSIQIWLMQKALREWRKQIRNHYLKYGADRIPSMVMPDQWANIVSYWESDKFKKISVQNKINKSKSIMCPRLGSMSHAQYREDEYHLKKVRPSRYKVYCEANKPFPNRPHTERANKILSDMQNFVETQLTQGSIDGTTQEVSEIEEEAMRKFLGPEKTDRTRSVGAGVMRLHRLRVAHYAPHRLQIADENTSRLMEENTMLKDELNVYREWIKTVSTMMGVPPPPRSDDHEVGVSERASASQRPQPH